MLYGYAKPTFVNASNAPITNFIYGLKVTWREQDGSNVPKTPIITESSARKTILYDIVVTGTGSDFSITLKLAAKHQFLNKYYYKQAYLNNTFGVETGVLETTDNKTVQTSDNYVVNVGNNNGISGVSCVYNKDVVLICDVNGLQNYLSSHTCPELEVEPFNVVFDIATSAKDVAANDIYIADAENRYSIANNSFTNYPNGGSESSDLRFYVEGNNVGFELGSTTPNTEDGYIKSINGILPTYGNINIKVLALVAENGGQQ